MLYMMSHRETESPSPHQSPPTIAHDCIVAGGAPISPPMELTPVTLVGAGGGFRLCFGGAGGAFLRGLDCASASASAARGEGGAMRPAAADAECGWMRSSATPRTRPSMLASGSSAPGTVPPTRECDSSPSVVSSTSVESDRCLRVASIGGLDGGDITSASRLLVESLCGARSAATSRGGAGAGRCLRASAVGRGGDGASSVIDALAALLRVRFSALRLVFRRWLVDGARRCDGRRPRRVISCRLAPCRASNVGIAGPTGEPLGIMFDLTGVHQSPERHRATRRAVVESTSRMPWFATRDSRVRTIWRRLYGKTRSWVRVRSGCKTRRKVCRS
jgi:hypothetical protein